jgi:hypothetical protein
LVGASAKSPSKRGGARQAGLSKFAHKKSQFRHSHSNGVPGHFLQQSKLKFENFRNDVGAEDYERDMNLDIDDIFTVKETFTRDSKTAGAMREPLRTLSSQANLDKFLEPGTTNPKRIVELKPCTKVGTSISAPIV